MQLFILGIIAIGGGLLFIYYALHRWPPKKGGGARSPNEGPDDNGKVIYLFGPEPIGTEKAGSEEDKGGVPRDPPGNGD
jgi:hypothetical protein